MRKSLVLYVSKRFDGEDYPKALVVAGFDIVTTNNVDYAVFLATDPDITAAVIRDPESHDGFSLAEKLKLMNRQLPVILIPSAAQQSKQVPFCVDAMTCSEIPADAAASVASFLVLSQSGQCAAA